MNLIVLLSDYFFLFMFGVVICIYIPMKDVNMTYVKLKKCLMILYSQKGIEKEKIVSIYLTCVTILLAFKESITQESLTIIVLIIFFISILTYYVILGSTKDFESNPVDVRLQTGIIAGLSLGYHSYL